MKKDYKVGQIEDLTDAIIAFRDDRDWKQFHNTKDLAVALSIEVSELLENFLWKNHDEADSESIKEELADVLTYALLLAHEEELDVEQIIREKLNKNSEKYPIDKARGTAKKYDEL